MTIRWVNDDTLAAFCDGTLAVLDVSAAEVEGQVPVREERPAERARLEDGDSSLLAAPRQLLADVYRPIDRSQTRRAAEAKSRDPPSDAASVDHDSLPSRASAG
jgi:hypothetical protein